VSLEFRSGIAEATLIKDKEVEAGEVRCDQGELLAQGPAAGVVQP